MFFNPLVQRLFIVIVLWSLHGLSNSAVSSVGTVDVFDAIYYTLFFAIITCRFCGKNYQTYLT